MKIGCCGLGGTGKTTTLRHLQWLWEKHSIEFFPSVMSGILRRYNCTTERGLFTLESWKIREAQLSGFYKRVHTEKQLESTQTSWVSDRTLLDHFAYLICWTGTAWMQEYEVHKYEQELFESLEQYDAILYFSSEKFRQLDTSRVSNPIHDYVWLSVVEKYIDCISVPFYEIDTLYTTGNILEERSKVICMIIEGLITKQGLHTPEAP